MMQPDAAPAQNQPGVDGAAPEQGGGVSLGKVETSEQGGGVSLSKPEDGADQIAAADAGAEVTPAMEQTAPESAMAFDNTAMQGGDPAPDMSAQAPMGGFCTGCGKPLGAGAMFCIYCGKKANE